jgi:hypothetical protein
MGQQILQAGQARPVPVEAIDVLPADLVQLRHRGRRVQKLGRADERRQVVLALRRAS